jgi:predicted RNase H-like HicB family nuclease
VTLKVLIHKAEEGGYWAEAPALPGCVSQGETMDEVRTNIREAIEGWLLAEEGAAQAGEGRSSARRDGVKQVSGRELAQIGDSDFPGGDFPGGVCDLTGRTSSNLRDSVA